jgi:UDP-glucose 4-epimerase
MTRVLLTGGSGFVAAHVLNFLLERGYERVFEFEMINPLTDDTDILW